MTHNADLSHVFDNPDTDSAQSSWQRAISPSLHLHLSKAINHHLGLSDEHPGKYKGPSSPENQYDPKDSLGNPEDQENATESHQDQAIANVSDFGNSPNVLSPPKPVKPSMPPPSAAEL